MIVFLGHKGGTGVSTTRAGWRWREILLEHSTLALSTRTRAWARRGKRRRTPRHPRSYNLRRRWRPTPQTWCIFLERPPTLRWPPPPRKLRPPAPSGTTRGGVGQDGCGRRGGARRGAAVRRIVGSGGNCRNYLTDKANTGGRHRGG